jgi:hypothetical protein
MPVRVLQPVNVGDVRVVERRKHLGFALKAGHTIGVCRKGLRQDFDGHVALQSTIPRAIHLAHAARAD